MPRAPFSLPLAAFLVAAVASHGETAADVSAAMVSPPVAQLPELGDRRLRERERARPLEHVLAEQLVEGGGGDRLVCHVGILG